MYMDTNKRCWEYDAQSEEGILMELRKGPWTVEEDSKLINHVTIQGEGHWNSLAQSAGLKRTGKSCRLRWLNYLRPDIRRGNLTLEEQFLILELHCRLGNRWSKIAQHLPGRTDNEIKNYWRTRIQKQAKQLKCQVNTEEFRDTVRYLWLPRLAEQIRASAASASMAEPSSTTTISNHDSPTYMTTVTTLDHILTDPTSECEKSIASSHLLEDQIFPALDFTDCDDVPGNNWPSSLRYAAHFGLDFR